MVIGLAFEFLSSVNSQSTITSNIYPSIQFYTLTLMYGWHRFTSVIRRADAVESGPRLLGCTQYHHLHFIVRHCQPNCFNISTDSSSPAKDEQLQRRGEILAAAGHIFVQDSRMKVACAVNFIREFPVWRIAAAAINSSFPFRLVVGNSVAFTPPAFHIGRHKMKDLFPESATIQPKMRNYKRKVNSQLQPLFIAQDRLASTIMLWHEGLQDDLVPTYEKRGFASLLKRKSIT